MSLYGYGGAEPGRRRLCRRNSAGRPYFSFAVLVFFVVFLHRVALGIGVAQGECLVHRLIRRAIQLLLRFVVFIVACGPPDLLKDAARVVSGRDIRRAVFREAAEKSGFAPRRRRERCQREQDEPPRTTPAARRRARAPAPAGSPVGRSPSIVISAAFASVHDLPATTSGGLVPSP